MGKLSDLWSEFKTLDRDDPKRKEIQKEINNVEQWMIDKGYKKDGITQWYDSAKVSPHYPHNCGYISYEDLEKLIREDAV